MWPPMLPSPFVKFYEPVQRVISIKGWTASAGAVIFTQLPATPFKHGPVSQAQAHGQINPCHTSLRKKTQLKHHHKRDQATAKLKEHHT